MSIVLEVTSESRCMIDSPSRQRTAPRVAPPPTPAPYSAHDFPAQAHRPGDSPSASTRLSSFVDEVRNRIRETPSWVVLVQSFIGLGWLRAGVEKVIDPTWWSGAYLDDFLDEHAGESLGWYEPFIDLIVSPLGVVISAVVMVAQFAVAGSLLSGRRVAAGLAAGIFLNLNFIAAGAVSPSVFYVLSQGALALWYAERSQRRDTANALEITAAVGAGMALAQVPWIETLAPADVIEDPAIIMATVGGFAALGAMLALERRRSALIAVDAANGTHVTEIRS